MMNREVKKKNKESGFSLIEILIAIVVMGILGSLAVSSVGGSSDKAVASSMYENTKKLVQSISNVNTVAGTSKVITSSNTSLMDSVASFGLGIDEASSTTELDELAALAVLAYYDGTDVVAQGASSAVTLFAQSTDPAKVQAFTASGVRPLGDVFVATPSATIGSGTLTLEGYRLVNILTTNNATMRVTYQSVPQEICQILVDKYGAKVTTGSSESTAAASTSSDCTQDFLSIDYFM